MGKGGDHNGQRLARARVRRRQAAAISIPALRGRVEDMSGRHRSAALASMGHDLPGLLRDLRVARRAVPVVQRAAVSRRRAAQAVMAAVRDGA